MQQLLDHVAEFCRQSCISLNPSKSVQVVMSTSSYIRNASIPQSLFGTAVPSATSARFLGILVSSSMNFAEQCLAARQRIQQRLRIVQATCSTTWGLDQQSSNRLVTQYVLSSGLYAAPAYFGLATQQGQHHLQVAYNQCLRVVTGCTQSTPINLLHECAGAPTLTTRISRQASNIANTAKRHPTPTPSSHVLASTPSSASV